VRGERKNKLSFTRHSPLDTRLLSQVVAQGSPALFLMFIELFGPQSRAFDPRPYARVIHVGMGSEHQTVAGALASIKDPSPTRRYAVLVAAGTYHESSLRLKPHIDLYGGFGAGDWKTRNVYEHRAPRRGAG